MTTAAPSNVNTRRRAGRRPSKEIDVELSEDFDLSAEFSFGCYENKIQQVEIQGKLEAAKKAVANGGAPQPKRSAPERSLSSDSYEDYHKKVFESH